MSIVFFITHLKTRDDCQVRVSELNDFSRSSAFKNYTCAWRYCSREQACSFELKIVPYSIFVLRFEIVIFRSCSYIRNKKQIYHIKNTIRQASFRYEKVISVNVQCCRAKYRHGCRKHRAFCLFLLKAPKCYLSLTRCRRVRLHARRGHVAFWQM